MSGNERVINSYAKAIYDIGEESKTDITQELVTLQEVINSSNELETALFLDVFTYEEKAAVIEDITKALGSSAIVKNFLLFLLETRRFSLFPHIFSRIVTIDDDKKGFIKGTIKGKEEKLDTTAMKKIAEYLEKKIGKQVKFEYQKDEEMVGGYKVTVGDLQLDASLDNQLDILKEQILSETK